MPDPTLALLLSTNIGLLVYTFHLLKKVGRVEAALAKSIASPQGPPSPPSEELTEFLTDFKKHGYSFVRVDPTNVLLRSPRD